MDSATLQAAPNPIWLDATPEYLTWALALYFRYLDLVNGDRRHASALPASKPELGRALLTIIAATRDPDGVMALVETGATNGTTPNPVFADEVTAALIELPRFLEGEEHDFYMTEWKRSALAAPQKWLQQSPGALRFMAIEHRCMAEIEVLYDRARSVRLRVPRASASPER